MIPVQTNPISEFETPGNLFQESVEEKPKPLFELETPQVEPSPYSEDQKLVTSTLGALAQQWNAASDETLNSVVTRINEMLDKGEEPQLREQISNTSKQTKLDAIKQLQVDVLQGMHLESLACHLRTS